MANEEAKRAKADAEAAKAKAKVMRPWHKKKRIVIPLVLLMLIGLSTMGGGTETNSELPNDEATPSLEELSSDKISTIETSPNDSLEDESTKLTVAQQNAVRSAESYISFSGFSRQGLIDQLSSEYGDQYSVEDATFAVDSLNIDYDEQAERSAESYLEFSGFSCQGLIDQLSSDFGDKYTPNQARNGAKAVGICE